MTQDRYLEMMEQLGRDPVPEEMPPDITDLPDVMQVAMATFNMLGDRVYPDIGYIGKDYANLKYYIEIHKIEDVEFFLEILNWLDSTASFC